MGANLDRIQCAVIFCAVVVSALFYCTFDTFVTFFHVKIPPQICYKPSMLCFLENITEDFSFLKKYDTIVPL